MTFLQSLNKFFNIQPKTNKILAYIDEVLEEMDKMDYIGLPPIEITNTYDKLCCYDNDVFANYDLKDIINYYKETLEKIKVHNNHLTKVLEDIKSFNKDYSNILDNPISYYNTYSQICEKYIKSVNVLNNKFRVKNSDAINFLNNWNIVSNRYNDILKQYDYLQIVNNLLDIKEDYYIDDKQAEAFIVKFEKMYDKVKDLDIYNFPTIEDYKDAIKKSNEIFIENHINDSILNDVNGLSLDEDQRRAVLTDENTTLVVAGAGSGKTLTICGKVKYLIEKLGIDPKEILIMTFNSKSKDDLNEKIKNIHSRLNAYTFHKIGLEILKKPESSTFVIEDQFDKIVKDYLMKDVQGNPALLNKLIEYISYYSQSINCGKKYKSKGELYKDLKSFELETLKDMVNNKELVTYNNEKVKSFEELVIANYYFLNGIEYIYESTYEHSTDNSEYRQYQPDFYLPKYNLYHEHFGIDRNNQSSLFEDDEGKRYVSGIEWKRKIHRIYETNCIETFSYNFQENDIFKVLKKQLIANGVKFNPISKEELWKKLCFNVYDIDSIFNLIKSFISLYKSKYTDDSMFEKLKYISYNNLYDSKRSILFLDICKDVYNHYRNLLHYSTIEEEYKEKIDFDDMILQSTEIIDKIDSFRYKYIIVDEFQDISYSRMVFLKSLKNHGNAKLFLVGDDWQSIYRFAGSDVNIFLNAEKYFGKTTMCLIRSTHRYSQELIDIVEPFITKNKEQIKKEVVSDKHQDHPVKLILYKDDKINAFLFTLRYISDLNSGANVLILGRKNRDINSILPSYGVVYKRQSGQLIFNDYPQLNLKFSTVHKSKGLEADYVILINAENGKSGFPNKLEDDPILKLVMSDNSTFPYSEERRLFYVALTRTKNLCFILVNSKKPSEFLTEIKKGCHVHKMSDNNSKKNNISCPECKEGFLELKNNKFYGCTLYPYCKYTIDDIIAVKVNNRCPYCGDFLVKKKSSHGEEFLACHGYPKCRFTHDLRILNYKKNNNG